MLLYPTKKPPKKGKNPEIPKRDLKKFQDYLGKWTVLPNLQFCRTCSFAELAVLPNV